MFGLLDIAPGFQMLAARIALSRFCSCRRFFTTGRSLWYEMVDGDIIHADQYGAVVIPAEALNDLKSAAEQIIKREQVIIRAAQKPGFNIDEL